MISDSVDRIGNLLANVDGLCTGPTVPKFADAGLRVGWDVPWLRPCLAWTWIVRGGPPDARSLHVILKLGKVRQCRVTGTKTNPG